MAARSSAVSSINALGIQAAIRVSNRNTEAMPSGTSPSHEVGANK